MQKNNRLPIPFKPLPHDNLPLSALFRRYFLRHIAIPYRNSYEWGVTVFV